MSGDLFAIVKPTCVALLGSATLTPSSIPNCISQLNDLIDILRAHSSELPQLSPSLVSYIFFPVSSILQRNEVSIIPDQILEKVFVLLGFLSESWWWHCEIAIWEQIFMLCGSVLGGMANGSRTRCRDDQVKQAAAQCLYNLLRQRETESAPTDAQRAKARLIVFQNYAQSPHFIPILGQTLSAVIESSESRTFSLQQTSLKVLRVLLELYAPDQVFPMILPGVISSMSRVALGTKLERQWANGDIVAAALRVMQIATVRSIGDGICAAEGALHRVDDLESLREIVTPFAAEPPEGRADSPFITKRTPSWLKGTASQLHIAINNLDSLTGHPSPIALRALASFSGHILEATTETLSQTQPLLLAFLLSVSNSSFDKVSSEARSHLLTLLSNGSKSQASLLQTLMRNMSEYLSALPRLIAIQEESKAQHVTGLIEAICRLASLGNGPAAGTMPAVAKGIGKLLGPSGGVEKWGWSLLSVFEFSEAPLTVVQTSVEQLMLESDPNNPQLAAFPGLQPKNIRSDTLQAVESMFRTLGNVGGETCLYSVEWFIGIGKGGTGRNAVAAMWCACRLLEGVSGINLYSEDSVSCVAPKPTRRLEKLSRYLARSLPELWDQQFDDIEEPAPPADTTQDLTDMSLIERKKGLHSLHENLKIIGSRPATVTETSYQPVNHRALALQVISVCVGILQSRSSSLFIHVLYPVLHSLVSQVPFLASTAYASLQFMTAASSYASPANLLLSNFDYALDAISRRLTRRRLDIVATRVLVVLIRLVGSDVVEKAGDVVEECFDRLDEFHGYDILVEGLVNVLVEVTKSLRNEASTEVKREKEPVYTSYAQLSDLSTFFQWYRKRHESNSDEDLVDYGPAPRRAWAEKDKNKEKPEQEENEGMTNAENPSDELPPTPTQALTKQIVSRSLYFLTHGSPVIRARILTLLASSTPNLPSSALMPAIHSAWPFILNRLSDQETFVVSAAALLIEMLSTYMGEFMFRRIWDDVWPRFRILLSKLQDGDNSSALVWRGESLTGPGSAYTHSHRLYRALLNTMTAAVRDVRPHERSLWDLLVMVRRFLDHTAHPELQSCARRLYTAAMVQNADATWLVLSATFTQDHAVLAFLYNAKWDITDNARIILGITPVE